MSADAGRRGGPPRRPHPLHGRVKARRAALQALYQWLVAGQDLRSIEQQFLAEQDMRGVDLEYFHTLLFGVAAQVGELEARFLPFLDRPPEELDPVERTILRIGAYEMAERPEVPFRVVINEAVELAKRFGAEEGHRYVNGVLDKLAPRLRPVETGGRRRA
jgi:N utilization substance protein B